MHVTLPSHLSAERVNSAISFSLCNRSGVRVSASLPFEYVVSGRMNQEQESFSTCEDCGSLSFSQQWHKAFGVRLCNDCRGGYGLISKVPLRVPEALMHGTLSRPPCAPLHW